MKNPQILIVDDDPDIHNFIKHDLKKSSFEVQSAFTVEEAIQKLSEQDFTLAVIDIFLGKNESFNQVIHFLKQDQAGSNKNLPFAIMSARIDEDYSKKLFLKGPTVFSIFRKPFKTGEIQRRIEGREDPTVLVVDDDPDILSLIKRELLEGGYQVFGALGNDQAIKLLKTTEFLAAVIDNKLGQSSNTEGFAAFVSELPVEKQIPLILTGKKINQNILNDEKLIVLDSIEKPFKKGAFLNSLNKIKIWNQNEGKDFESVTVVSGKEAEDDSETIVGGWVEKEDDFQTTVGGWEEKEDDFSITIEGMKEDLKEESQLIKGESFHPDDHVTIVKGFDAGEFDENQPNKRNKQGITPAMAYCYTGDFEKVKELVKNGADLSLKSRNGKTSLHYAAFSKNYELVEFLVNVEKVKINQRDEAKREPLYDAIKANDPEMVKTLIRLGARINSKFDGRSYLTLAVLLKVPEVAKVLFDFGISPKDKDYNGKTTLDYCAKLGFNDLLEYFASKGDKS